jgi:hypothetical protein
LILPSSEADAPAYRWRANSHSDRLLNLSSSLSPARITRTIEAGVSGHHDNTPSRIWSVILGLAGFLVDTRSQMKKEAAQVSLINTFVHLIFIKTVGPQSNNAQRLSLVLEQLS